MTGDGSRIPHDFDAEREVLGILIAHPRMITDQCASNLDVEHFYAPHHQAIWCAVKELGSERTAADIAVICERLRANGVMCRLKAYRDDQYLITLASDSDSPDGLAYLCRKLGKLAAKRTAVLAAAQTPYLGIAAEVFADWSEPPPALIPTGIQSLDQALGGGLMSESVTVLCAGTSRGKTGLVVQIATYWLAQGEPVLFIETELSRRQVSARFLGPILRLPWLDVFHQGQQEAARLAELAHQYLQRLNVHIWTPGDSLRDIVSQFAHSTGRAPRIILDQVGDLARSRSVESMRNAAAAVSADMKEIARLQKGLIVAVCPVSRTVTSDMFKGRSGTDFEGAAKDAGEVEYDAATVLYLEFVRGKRKEPAAAQLHIAKSRGGPPDQVIDLHFHGALGVFDYVPAQGSPGDEQAVIAALTAKGRPIGVNVLARELHMGQPKVERLLDNLDKAGRIERTPIGARLARAKDSR